MIYLGSVRLIHLLVRLVKCYDAVCVTFYAIDQMTVDLKFVVLIWIILGILKSNYFSARLEFHESCPYILQIKLIYF